MRLIDYFERARATPRPVGKVLTKTLRDPYWAGHERKI
jgi:hypothetical protein